MRRKRVILVIGVFVVILGGLAWLLVPAPDPLFHGKPESEWIKSISYGVSISDAENQEQVKRWRDFGPEGVRVLARAVDKANHHHRSQRTYRKVYRRVSAMLPGFLVRLLPAPAPLVTSGPPTNAIDLLSRLGKDAESAAPAVARALKSEDSGVRNIAIGFFISPGSEDARLSRMKQKEKRNLLSDFIRAVEDKGANWALRSNAAVALKYYPEQRETIAPVLLKALQDPSPWVRQCAAESLYGVAPDLMSKSGVAPIVIGVLRDPDDQIASRAAFLLGEMRAQPALAVPALIESLENTNSLVDSTAAQALVRFKEQAEVIIPALEKAAQRKDNGGGWARSALEQLEPQAAANRGAPK